MRNNKNYFKVGVDSVINHVDYTMYGMFDETERLEFLARVQIALGDYIKQMQSKR